MGTITSNPPYYFFLKHREVSAHAWVTQPFLNSAKVGQEESAIFRLNQMDPVLSLHAIGPKASADIHTFQAPKLVTHAPSWAQPPPKKNLSRPVLPPCASHIKDVTRKKKKEENKSFHQQPLLVIPNISPAKKEGQIKAEQKKKTKKKRIHKNGQRRPVAGIGRYIYIYI